MSKFSGKKASVSQVNEYTEALPVGGGKKEIVRQLGDNKMFPELQCADIRKYTDDTTLWYLDGDGIVWKAAACVENLFITVSHPDGSIFEMAGVEEFKGRGKKPGAISDNSWLGGENVRREANGHEPYKLEDWTIVEGHRLKYDSEEKAFEQIQIMVRTKLKELRVQFLFNATQLRFCIGAGDCFRHDLDLPTAYKGTRSLLRPIMLERARQWIMDDLSGIEAPKGFETDDYVEWYGFEGYKAYRKTGKFTYAVIAEDKDAMGNPKLLANYGRNDTGFKYPNAWLIDSTDVTVGSVDMVMVGNKSELKGTGIKWLVCQAFMIGDSADGYHPYNKHTKEVKKNAKYGQTTAYKDLVGLTTVTGVLQLAVDNMAKWYPYGLQYTNHKGQSLDVDTLHWMNTCFSVAYMTRFSKDNTTFTQLAAHFGVDLSAVTDNNLFTEPVKQMKSPEEVEFIVSELQMMVQDAQMKGYKSKKKDLLVELLDETQDKLTLIESKLESIHHMTQLKK